VRRAQGGVGLVIASQSTPGDLQDWADPDSGMAFHPLIGGCHNAEAKIALQVLPGSGAVDELPAEQPASISERFARAAVGVREAGFDAWDIHDAYYWLFMRLPSPFRTIVRTATAVPRRTTEGYPRRCGGGLPHALPL